MKRLFALLISCLLTTQVHAASAESEVCINCHQRVADQPLVSHVDNAHQQFGLSCLDCHNATASNPGIEHYNYQLRLLPNSAGCQECHAK